MVDVKFIRENAELLKDVSQKKRIDPKIIDEILEVDKARRELILKAETVRAEQKKTKDREEGARLKTGFKEAEENLKPVEERFNRLMVLVPNIISPDTPVGESEADNREVYRWGEPKKFNFQAKDHVQLGRDLDIIDFERGTKVGGFRGYTGERICSIWHRLF
ncbi:MAG: hypothetical protein HYR95_00565 [Candidatus Colwellbacteria bacterium]|nr:hypothetical protein [Candidatus Colwellbacteria bacterium]